MTSRPESRSKPFAARHRRAAETHATILRAAADIFSQVGLAGARTDAIAQVAGVNKALLYYYQSKDYHYSAVPEDRLGEFLQRALEILGAQEAPSSCGSSQLL